MITSTPEIRIFSIIASFIGLYGAIWVIYHFVRRKIVFRGLAGALIVSIAIADCVHSLIYIYNGFYLLLDNGMNDLLYNLSQLANIFFQWEMLTSACLAIILAFNSLLIIYFGSGFTEESKYAIVMTSFLLPVAIYFLPASILRKEHIFAFYTDKSAHVEIFEKYFFFVYICLSVVLILGAYIAVFFRIRRFGETVFMDRNSAKRTILNLILTYSMAHILCTLPWIYFDFVFHVQEVSQRDADDPLRVFCQIPRLILTPFRGYIHALAVAIVSTKWSSGYTFLKKDFYLALLSIAFLVTSIDSNDTEEGLVHNLKNVSIEDIKWEFSNDLESTQK